jgi:uracil-DNA glycosylase
MQIKLHESWLKYLQSEFEQDYMKNLKKFLKEQYAKNKIIFPSANDFFAALNATAFDQVRVVILGQDPYHGIENGVSQAHGLSFSVPHGVRPPPSLQNIYKELESDLGLVRPGHGNLQAWAQQGILLLNSVLSVEKDKAASHQGKGWELFTDKIIQVLSNQRQNLVFILWGSYAHKKGLNIDKSKHLVIQSVHPSPLSAHRGFFGSKPFSKTNEYLKSKLQKPINWQLTS